MSVFKQDNNMVKSQLEMITLMPGWKEHAQKRMNLIAGEPIKRHVPSVVDRVCSDRICWKLSVAR